MATLAELYDRLDLGTKLLLYLTPNPIVDQQADIVPMGELAEELYGDTHSTQHTAKLLDRLKLRGWSIRTHQQKWKGAWTEGYILDKDQAKALWVVFVVNRWQWRRNIRLTPLNVMRVLRRISGNTSPAIV